MTPAKRLEFSSLNNTFFDYFNKELKNNSNKLYNILMHSLMIYTNSIFGVCPPELINYIHGFRVLVQDFPEWRHHSIKTDLNLTMQFCHTHRTRPPVVFSENPLD